MLANAELLGNDYTKYDLSNEQIYGQVFAILYSGYETVSIPKLLKKLERVKVFTDHVSNM
jgi:hypothetical protein